MKSVSALLTALLFSFSAGPASAALVDRGNGLIYDSALNVTWLQDANLAATNTFGVQGLGGLSPGLVSIDRASDWLSAMNSANYKGFSDWRLPTVFPSGTAFTVPTYSYNGPDYGFNPDLSKSELAYMFYVNLGNLGGHAVDGSFNCVSCLVNTGPFANLQPWLYATSSASAYDIAFNMGEGYQGAYLKNAISAHFWAVRTGDVAVSAVPEPSSATMMLTGLLLLAGGRRRVTPRL